MLPEGKLFRAAHSRRHGAMLAEEIPRRTIDSHHHQCFQKVFPHHRHQAMILEFTPSGAFDFYNEQSMLS